MHLLKDNILSVSRSRKIGKKKYTKSTRITRISGENDFNFEQRANRVSNLFNDELNYIVENPHSEVAKNCSQSEIFDLKQYHLKRYNLVSILQGKSLNEVKSITFQKDNNLKVSDEKLDEYNQKRYIFINDIKFTIDIIGDSLVCPCYNLYKMNAGIENHKWQG